MNSADILRLCETSYKGYKDEKERNGNIISNEYYDPFSAGYMNGFYENASTPEQLQSARYREKLLIKEVDELKKSLIEHKQVVDILGGRALKYEKNLELINTLSKIAKTINQ